MLPGRPLVSHNVSGAVWSFHVPLNGVRGRSEAKWVRNFVFEGQGRKATLN